MKYTLRDGEIFIKVARKAIDFYLRSKKIVYPEEIKKYNEKTGVFVTLRTYPEKELRGCIGFPRPVYPLWKSLVLSAISAATEDPRFPPVKADEMNRIIVEINILTEPQLIEVKDPSEYPEKIEIGKDGLIVEYGPYSGLLLPEVPVEENWDEITFLSYTCLKAGLPPDCWIKLPVKIYKFQSVIFREKEPNGEVEMVDLNK